MPTWSILTRRWGMLRCCGGTARPLCRVSLCRWVFAPAGRCLRGRQAQPDNGRIRGEYLLRSQSNGAQITGWLTRSRRRPVTHLTIRRGRTAFPADSGWQSHVVRPGRAGSRELRGRSCPNFFCLIRDHWRDQRLLTRRRHDDRRAGWRTGKPPRSASARSRRSA